MALVPRRTHPTLSSVLPQQANVIASGIQAGENIAGGDVCYIHSDGTARRSDGTADNAAARARGIAAREADAGQPVTLFRDVEFGYGEGLTPGIDLFVAETPGRLDTAPTTGGLAPVAFTVDGTRIFFHGDTSISESFAAGDGDGDG